MSQSSNQAPLLPNCVPVEDSTVLKLYGTPANRKLSTTSTQISEGGSLSKCTEFNSDYPPTVLPHIPFEASGYKSSKWRDGIYWIIGFLSLGISLLLSSWFHVVALKLRRLRCPITQCDLVLLKTMNGKETPLPIVTRRIKRQDLNLILGHSLDNAKIIHSSTPSDFVDVLSFEFHCHNFIFDHWHMRFINAEFPIEKVLFSSIWDLHGTGVQDTDTIESRRQLFGKCEVHIPLKSSVDLVITECLHPFYVFQICSLILWFFDNYYYYASAVLLLSCISLLVSIRETLKNNLNLHEMAKFSCSVRAIRKTPSHSVRFLNSFQLGECLEQFNSTELVPGDIFTLERGMKLPCDGILLTGSVLVDESMMTGESKPVYKTALPFVVPLKDLGKDELFSFKHHHKHVLYGGSEIRDSNHLGAPALCLVARSGFSTEQGYMMRSLIHPVDSTRMNFEKETWKFVGLLAGLSCFTFCLTLYQGIRNELHPLTIFKRSIDTVTIAVPPALPIIIAVGIICAQDALKRKSGTRCLAPSRINVAGRTNVLVFDKTGTLTEDDEDLLAIIPSIHVEMCESSFDEVISTLAARFPKGTPFTTSAFTTTPSTHDRSLPHLGIPATCPQRLPADLLVGLATCHSLGFVDKELIGDPLEYQMFNFTGWNLSPPKTNDDSINDSENVKENLINQPIALDDPDMYMSVWPSDDYDMIKHSLDYDNISILDSNDGSISSITNVSTFPAYVILRVFEFDPYLQRMSVIVQNRETNEFKAYIKGSPERIVLLCRHETIPYNWNEVLSDHTERGLRVLGIAQKNITVDGPPTPSAVQQLNREDVEQGFDFLGLLLFTNLLRPDSASAINDLQSAGCCTYMATGDSPATGAAIGFQAGILPADMNSLISGFLLQGQLKWKIEPFGQMYGNEPLKSQSCSNLTPTDLSESNSLLKLIQGRCLSKVGLSITGEAFRYTVSACSKTSQEPSPLLHDLFEIDAFTSKKKSNRFCIPRKKNLIILDSVRKWDSQPHYMNTLEFILRYFQIFSRMSPDDKVLLVKQLQSLPNAPIVGMCGDGANDCAALKASDVGISLSSKEASVAAPFNCSKQKTIRVVLDVLGEGRGALANSIQNFQFVALYAMIQLCSVTLLSHFGCSLADAQFLYMDLAVVLPLTYFMSWSKSSPTLTRVLPPQSLLAWSITVSLVGQVIIQVLFQVAALFIVLPKIGARFYTPFEIDLEKETDFIGYENTITFLVSNIQTVMIALILAFGTRPWKIVTRNGYFLLGVSIFAIIGFALVLNEAPYMMWLRHLMNLVSLPLSFRTILLVLISINILLSVALEEGFIRGILRRMEAREDKKILNRESLRGDEIDEMVLNPSRHNDRDVCLCIDAEN